MRASDWFAGWLRRHLQRHPRNDWPDPASEGGQLFFGGWRTTLQRHGVREAEADLASELLQAEAVYPERHLERLLELVKGVWAEERKELSPAWSRDPRVSALEASRDCPDCYGQGMAYRYRRNPPVDELGRLRLSILCYCRCSYGRWLRDTHRNQCRNEFARIYDLDAYPFLWGEEYSYPSHLRHLDIPVSFSVLDVVRKDPF